VKDIYSPGVIDTYGHWAVLWIGIIILMPIRIRMSMLMPIQIRSDWRQNDADPHAIPIPVLHMLENQILLLWSQHCQWFIFLISVKRVTFFNNLDCQKDEIIRKICL
jgi:hypothetical protein